MLGDQLIGQRSLFHSILISDAKNEIVILDDAQSILDEFGELPDLRSSINRKHLFSELVVICMENRAESPTPLVSVLMTVYNGMPHLESSLDSLVRQTLFEIEIIVVDDGSSDASCAYVEELSARDNRIKLFTPGRIGRAAALNYGLEKSAGDFVMINDADDTSYPSRAEKQLRFLLDNPEYGLVGSICETVDHESGITSVTQLPEADREIRSALTNGQPLQHISIMFRKSVLTKIGGYSNRRFLLDREIFIRVLQVSKGRNLPEILATVNHHSNRFFYHGFQGRVRAQAHYLMCMKAVWRLGFPKWKMLKPLLGIVALYIPRFVRNLIPSGIRSRFHLKDFKKKQSNPAEKKN